MIRIDDCHMTTTSKSIWSQVCAGNHDAATVRSILGNIFHLHLNIDVVTVESGVSFYDKPMVSVPLQGYRDEFDADCIYEWGTYNNGAKQLSYAVCRLLLGEEKWAKKVWYPFMLEYTLFWPEKYIISLDLLHRQIAQIAQRL